jgi:hypothetical protein
VKALVAACLLAAGASGAQVVSIRGDALVFEGSINARSGEAFQQLVRDPRVTRVVITSGGGQVATALDMAEAIRERGLDVEVPDNCRSSCANYIFPAGRRKLLGHPAAVSWHGNMTHVLYTQQTGQSSWTEPQMASARLLAQREAEFYRRLGVDGFVCWFAKIPPYNVPDFYWLSPGDMAGFGIGDVTVRSAAQVADAELVRVRVDWAGLESIRPAMSLLP